MTCKICGSKQTVAKYDKATTYKGVPVPYGCVCYGCMATFSKHTDQHEQISDLCERTKKLECDLARLKAHVLELLAEPGNPRVGG